MTKTAIFIFVVLGILTIAIICIIAMLVSISKVGDERRKLIVEKTCANSFLATVGILIISVVENLIRVFALHMEIHQINPIIFLIIVAVVYAIQLVYYKKKFGD